MNFKIDLINKATDLRKRLGETESSPIDIMALAHTIDNLTLIFYPLGKNVSGVCYKGTDSNVIAINSEMSLGRQCFSLAHEFYHLYFDEQVSAVSMKQIGKGDINEKKADQFASYFLIPNSSLYSFIRKCKENNPDNKLKINDIIKMEQYYGVSHQAMLYRLVEEEEIILEEKIQMSSNVIKTASKLGYDTELYSSSSEKKKMLVLGYYINEAEELLYEDYISQGKYEELLLNAFREDIVYGFEEEEFLD